MGLAHYIVGGSILCLLEAILILVLVVQGRRRKAAEEALTDRLRFEHLLTGLSAKFVSVSAEQVDQEIEGALQRICEHLGFDLAALWQWKEVDLNWLTMTHLYRPMEGPPLPDRIDAREMFPWSLEQLAANKIIAVFTEELPPEAARDQAMWRHYGIKSSLVFPLSSGGKPILGALSLNAIRQERQWPEAFVKRLQLVAEIFANALARKHSMQILRESEERLDLAASSADMGMWVLNVHTGDIWASDKARDLYGFGPNEELTLERVIGVCYPDDREKVRINIMGSLKSGVYSGNEYRVVRPDGAIRWMATRGRAYLGLAGVPERIMGVVMDITEHKEAEAAAMEAQSTIRALVESTDDMIWSVDPDRFGLLTFNSTLRDYFLRGLGLDLALGMSPYDMVRGPFTRSVAEKWRQLYKRALREGSFSEEYRTSAEARTLLLSFNLLKRAGKVFGISVFGKDMTTLKKAEAEAFTARRELWRTDRLLRMGELTASLAHELNQPLTSILSNARAAIRFIKSDRIDMAELVEILEDIAADDKRAGDIIRNLRAMVKPEEGEEEMISINDVLLETLSLFHSESVIRDVRIRRELAPDLPPVRGNKVQLQQVLINLLMNAAESMTYEQGDRVIILRTRVPKDDRIRVSLRDFGTGIDEQELGRIFEPFFTTKHAGLGMGLSLARSIIEAQGGRIWAQNNADKGATISFELPVLKN